MDVQKDHPRRSDEFGDIPEVARLTSNFDGSDYYITMHSRPLSGELHPRQIRAKVSSLSLLSTLGIILLDSYRIHKEGTASLIRPLDYWASVTDDAC